MRQKKKEEEKSHISYATVLEEPSAHTMLLCSGNLLAGKINGWVSFISAAMLPLKASSLEMEEEVRGCALPHIRYTVVALGYYSLIDSE